MVEDMKEPQGTGVTAMAGDPDQQGNILTITLLLAPETEIVSSF